MNAKHTQSTWSSEGIALCMGGQIVATGIAPDDATTEEQRANARRIVACVNACDGLTTESLESMRFSYPDAYYKLLQERHALIGALMAMHVAYPTNGASINAEQSRASDLARDTINAVCKDTQP